MEKAVASGNGREKAVREQMEQERGNDGDIHPAWTRTNFSRQQPGHQIEYQAGDRNGRGNFLRSLENGISRPKQVRPKGNQVDAQPQQERHGGNGQNDGGGFRHGADSITPIRPPATRAPPRTPPRAARCFRYREFGSFGECEGTPGLRNSGTPRSESNPATMPESSGAGQHKSILFILQILQSCRKREAGPAPGGAWERLPPERGATRAFPSRCPARRRTRCGGRRRRGGRGRGRGSRAARCRCS